MDSRPAHPQVSTWDTSVPSRPVAPPSRGHLLLVCLQAPGFLSGFTTSVYAPKIRCLVLSVFGLS